MSAVFRRNRLSGEASCRRPVHGRSRESPCFRSSRRRPANGSDASVRGSHSNSPAQRWVGRCTAIHGERDMPSKRPPRQWTTHSKYSDGRRSSTASIRRTCARSMWRNGSARASSGPDACPPPTRTILLNCGVSRASSGRVEPPRRRAESRRNGRLMVLDDSSYD